MMFDKSLVSVIIPTYNRNFELKRAINSVLKQTYDSFEIIVVDDYGTGETRKTIDEIKSKKIIYYVNEHKKGANGARNTGILKSNGEYIAFLDDDDEWLPNKLESNINILKNFDDSYVGVFSGFFTQYGNNKVITEYNENQDIGISDILLDDIKVASGSNLILRRKVFREIGLWDEELQRQQDLELLIRILNNYKLAYDDKILLIVNGHNTPEPRKAFEEREKFLAKVKYFVDIQSSKNKSKFYSNHYRRQANYLFMQNKYKEAMNYWLSAAKHKPFVLRKDLKSLATLIKSFMITVK
ncbi:MAG: glycosyltransferase [Melioribacteraceae bacterium]|nr:glycosyltransferase [Melioribacteraceae bacterium]